VERVAAFDVCDVNVAKYDVAAFHYSLFGLTLRSNLKLPHLPIAEDQPSVPDCELSLGTSPENAKNSADILTYTSTFTDRCGEPALRIWEIDDGAYLRMDYSDGHQFWLDRAGGQVWGVWPEGSSLEEATSYLLGPVMGVLLRHRGIICLHASAVAINDRAVAFVGPPGAGKSTMAAALAQGGCRVLADDIATIEERDGVFYVHPGYPGVCLWPNSIGFLYGEKGLAGAPFMSGDKRCLSTEEGLRFEARPLPLDRICILGYRKTGERTASLDTSAQGLFLALVANTYASNILDVQMRATELAVLGRMSSAVRLCAADCERGADQLKEYCNRLLQG